MIRRAVSEHVLAGLRDEAERLALDHPDQAHGIRQLLERSPLIAAWSRSLEIRSCLPPHVQPVRAILFDKTPETNWNVAWHQDLTISVRRQADAPGYGPWSVKEGIIHVQPPPPVLETLVTLRLHLDPTPGENGALRVIPGSHRQGRLDARTISELRRATPEHVCEAEAGDVLLMKPLLLHASSASARPGHRRVLHIEYADPETLHPSLQWAAL
jgi:hypothetical protein